MAAAEQRDYSCARTQRDERRERGSGGATRAPRDWSAGEGARLLSNSNNARVTGRRSVGTERQAQNDVGLRGVRTCRVVQTTKACREVDGLLTRTGAFSPSFLSLSLSVSISTSLSLSPSFSFSPSPPFVGTNAPLLEVYPRRRRQVSLSLAVKDVA